MCFDDFDFGDFLGLALAIGEEMADEERERMRIEQDFNKDEDENLVGD